MPSKLSLGFLGAGKIASALARGLIKARLVSDDQVIASDVSEAALTAFAAAVGARTASSNIQVVRGANTLFLAVKPEQITGVLAEICGSLTPEHLLISVAAGVSLAKLEGGVPQGTRVIRVMPNTPTLVGCSAAAYALGTAAGPADAELVQKLFSAVGYACQVKEPLLDAVTGLSGSGPAYVYMFIEALSDGGVAAGLPRDLATKLAAQTVLGSAKMVLETGLHTGALKDMVASPGGTTIEGIHELEKGAFRATLISAVRAGAEKAKRLG